MGRGHMWNEKQETLIDYLARVFVVAGRKEGGGRDGGWWSVVVFTPPKIDDAKLCSGSATSW